MEFLLSKCIKPSVKDDVLGRTPLHYCVGPVFTNDRAKIVCKRNAILVILNTALHEACSAFSDADMIQLLLDLGANVEAKDIYNNTPLLHMAAIRATKVEQILLAC
jgi:hypothetical protein